MHGAVLAALGVVFDLGEGAGHAVQPGFHRVARAAKKAVRRPYHQWIAAAFGQVLDIAQAPDLVLTAQPLAGAPDARGHIRGRDDGVRGGRGGRSALADQLRHRVPERAMPLHCGPTVLGHQGVPEG